MSATNDPFVNRFNLPGVPNPLLPADIANLDYVNTYNWEVLAAVDLSGGAADEISSGTITARKILKVICYLQIASAVDVTIEFNDDSGATQYAYRRRNNDGAEVTTANNAFINLIGTISAPAFFTLDITNIAALEKIVLGNAGMSAAIPDTADGVGKWKNVADQITKIDIINTTAGGNEYLTNSYLVVLGRD